MAEKPTSCREKSSNFIVYAQAIAKFIILSGRHRKQRKKERRERTGGTDLDLDVGGEAHPVRGEDGEGPLARAALLQMGVQLVHPHVVEGQVVVGVAQLQVAGGRGTEK